MWIVYFVAELFELIVHYGTEWGVSAFVIQSLRKLFQTDARFTLMQSRCVFTKNLYFFHISFNYFLNQSSGFCLSVPFHNWKWMIALPSSLSSMVPMA